MRKSLNTRLAAVLLATISILAFTVGTASAAVISNGTVSVGIHPSGHLYDGSFIGMMRNSDGYDPISPGTPRDSWGVSSGATSGFADNFDYGQVNIVANGAPVFGLSTASISSFLNAGGPNLLQIDQAYSFVASNVLAIATTITNLTGGSTAVTFSRNVDFDVFPSTFFEITKSDPLSGTVSDASFWGFENPIPLVPYAFSSGPAGGVFGPGDLGGAYQLSLGSLGAGGATSFISYYALNIPGQSQAALHAQLAALGATFIVTSESTDGSNVAALAIGPAVPEPSSLALLGLGTFGLIGAARRRSQNKPL